MVCHFLTSISGNNFSYKDMDETMIPCYYDCPESILKLLSDTNNENALEYRRLCREKRRKRKNDLYRRCQWERLLNGKLEKQKGLLISMRQPISSKDHFGWQWTILGITKNANQ